MNDQMILQEMELKEIAKITDVLETMEPGQTCIFTESLQTVMAGIYAMPQGRDGQPDYHVFADPLQRGHQVTKRKGLM